MKEEIEIKEKEAEVILPIFSDPSFLLPNLLGAEEVKVEGKAFTAIIPLSFFTGAIVIQGSVYEGAAQVRYIFFIAGFEDKSGRIEISAEKEKVKIKVEINAPLGFLNERVLKTRVKKFEKNAEEMIRLERIKRKI